MDDKGRRVSEMTARMIGFKAITEDDIPANSVLGQRFGTLGELNTKLDLQGSKWRRERNAAKAATRKKAIQVGSASLQLQTLKDTALACESQQPGISQNFNMPSSKSAES